MTNVYLASSPTQLGVCSTWRKSLAYIGNRTILVEKKRTNERPDSRLIWKVSRFSSSSSSRRKKTNSGAHEMDGNGCVARHILFLRRQWKNNKTKPKTILFFQTLPWWGETRMENKKIRNSPHAPSRNQSVKNAEKMRVAPAGRANVVAYRPSSIPAVNSIERKLLLSHILGCLHSLDCERRKWGRW